MTKTKKKPKAYTIADLQDDDIYLLSKAVGLPPKHFFCYGSRWYKLYSLELIDEELHVTPHGLEMIKAYQCFLMN